MSEPQVPDPAASPSELPAGSIPPDPLLGSDSFIDPGRTDAGAESPEYQKHEHTPNVEFAPGVVIAAEPISMLRPGESSVEEPPRSVRRRNPEEMAKRPSWLPEDWKIDLKVRSSGASAGLIDRVSVLSISIANISWFRNLLAMLLDPPKRLILRPSNLSFIAWEWELKFEARSPGGYAGKVDKYYVEPTGQRKFRSKNEVLHFLETGNKKKRKPTSEADAAPSEQKKSSTKRKKPEAVKSDIKHPEYANGVKTDTRQEI
ncbi:hypothetical protein DH2020_028083 [Rehmannia glutinosa]|uniref:MBD domain-containing protein n=1 Tax=Rehmannia glutinosa TaxID=99300 RepID=A0ABR0VVZ3_REHGL